jgi:hypothetical protein
MLLINPLLKGKQEPVTTSRTRTKKPIRGFNFKERYIYIYKILINFLNKRKYKNHNDSQKNAYKKKLKLLYKVIPRLMDIKKRKKKKRRNEIFLSRSCNHLIDPNKKESRRSLQLDWAART